MHSAALDLSTKRRDKLYIIANILEITKEDTLKTQVMYKANLSFTQLNDYLEFLLKINLLEKTANNTKEKYRATSKGEDFVKRYYELIELLKLDSEKEKDDNVRGGISKSSIKISSHIF